MRPVPDSATAAAEHAERDALRAALDSQRRKIISIVESLDDDQARSSTLPSGWTPIGLVRHLTLSDERYWFDSIVGGRPLEGFPDEPGGDWLVGADETTEQVLDGYRAQIETSNRWIDATAIDAPPRARDPQWDEWGIDFPDLRTVLLHLLVETTTHGGHLDAAVELIDGRQRLVLD